MGPRPLVRVKAGHCQRGFGTNPSQDRVIIWMSTRGLIRSASVSAAALVTPGPASFSRLCTRLQSKLALTASLFGLSSVAAIYVSQERTLITSFKLPLTISTLFC